MSPMNALHDLGQSLWLDNITRNLVNSGTLQRHIDEFSVTGLTSNPTIFDHAIQNSRDYESGISREASRAKSRTCSSNWRAAPFSGIRWSPGGAKRRRASKQSWRLPRAIASLSISLSGQALICLLNSQIGPAREITPQRRSDTCS